MRAEQIGVQLYTLRDLCARDLTGTLRAVADMGYSAVELVGLYGQEPARLRATLDELGLRATSAHIGLDAFEADAAKVAADLSAVGCGHAVVPWLAPERRSSVAGARALAAGMNRWGEQMRAAGLRLAYHHHDFEFAPLDGTSFWEILTSETDPALVDLEVDVYWAAKAGHDPAALIRRYSGRTALIHLKDMAADRSSMAPAGEGVLDWEGILAAARESGAAWYLVELDTPKDALDDVRRSYGHMRARAQG